MWRKWVIASGEFFKGVFTLKILATFYGVAGGINIVVNYVVGARPRELSPQQIAYQTFITVLWLLFFYIVTYLGGQIVIKFLAWVGNHYPDWYYLPKLNVTTRITDTSEIEMTVAGLRRRQTITLRMVFFNITSSGTPLLGEKIVTSPVEGRLLIPLTKIIGKSKIQKIIGVIINKKIILKMGTSDENTKKIHSPGHYEINTILKGNFRNRKYSSKPSIKMIISDDYQVTIEE